MKVTIAFLVVAMIATAASGIGPYGLGYGQIDHTTTLTASGEFSTTATWDNGVPNATAQVEISGGLSTNVAASGTAGYIIVGASGGASVSGTLNVEAGATLDIVDVMWSGTDDYEYHSLDIGMSGVGNVTVGAGATVNCAGDIRIGGGPIWGDGGFEGNMTIEAGATINVMGHDLGNSASFDEILTDLPGQGALGIGDFSYDGTPRTLTINSATVNAHIWAMGGTVTLNGLSTASGFRPRPYAGGVHLVLGPGGRLDVGHLELGNLGLDPSGMGIPDGQWVTILYDGDGGYAPAGNIYFEPGLDPNWKWKVINGAPYSGDPNYLQVLVPEPATMVLLAIGGIGALLRKRR